ncbi:MAG: hypothetical protein ACRD5K_01660 [Candidatus Acidiferrales bacterium]
MRGSANAGVIGEAERNDRLKPTDTAASFSAAYITDRPYQKQWGLFY